VLNPPRSLCRSVLWTIRQYAAPVKGLISVCWSLRWEFQAPIEVVPREVIEPVLEVLRFEGRVFYYDLLRKIYLEVDNVKH